MTRDSERDAFIRSLEAREERIREQQAELELLRAQVELFRGFIGRMEWGQVSLPNRAARTVLNLADDWAAGRLPIGDRGLGAPPRPPDGPPQQLMRRGGQ